MKATNVPRILTGEPTFIIGLALSLVSLVFIFLLTSAPGVEAAAETVSVALKVACVVVSYVFVLSYVWALRTSGGSARSRPGCCGRLSDDMRR
jgi:hypothetical protein